MKLIEKAFGLLLIASLCMLMGCAKSSSIQNQGGQMEESELNNIFKEIDTKEVNEIAYAIGGGVDFVITDEALISDIISRFKELEISDGIATENMKAGHSAVNIKTSHREISFGMLSSELVSDWKVYKIDEDKGKEIMEYFRQLMEK